MEHYGILLVDDEPAYHAIISALLVPSDRPIDCVADAGAALAAIGAARYDLILMDIELGADDGRRLVGRVRAAAPWAAICPIVAFTTLKPVEGERHFIDQGFDGWLPKPFGAEDLTALVRRWLGDAQIGMVSDGAGEQLAALLGEAQAEAMIERLYANMGEAIVAIDGGADPRPLGHRLGGLSGTLGFAALSAAWLSMQNGDALAWPTVRALTLEAIARHAAAR